MSDYIQFLQKHVANLVYIMTCFFFILLIFSSLKMFSFLNLESNMHTDASKAFATDPLKTTEIRTTNHPQPIVSTTGNTTASHMSTISNNTLHSRAPMTAISSTKENTSFLPTQPQSIPFSFITSSKQNSLATVLSTLLHTTSGNDKAASPISLTQFYPPNSTTFNLTTATIPLHLNAHYQTTEAYPITSGTQSRLLHTTFFSRNTTTSAQITHVPLSTSATNKPSSLNTISPSFTLFYTKRISKNNTTSPLTKTLLSSTSINTATCTTKFTFSITKIPTTTPVHIISGHRIITTNTIRSGTGPIYIIFCDKGNQTSIIFKPMHIPASSSSSSLTSATPSRTLITTNTKLLTLASATPSRKPLSALITSNPKKNTSSFSGPNKKYHFVLYHFLILHFIDILLSPF